MKAKSRVRAGKRSKHKGDQFERDLANTLEEHFGNPKAPLTAREFRRTPLSGGFKQNYPSDLIVPDWFPFCIEAKKRATSELDLNLLPTHGRKHKLVQWFETEREKAWVGAQKSLLLVFERDYGEPLAMLATEVLEHLNLALAKGISIGALLVLRVRCNAVDVTILPLEHLLKGVTKERLTELGKYFRKGVPGLQKPASGAVSIRSATGALADAAASGAPVPPAGPIGSNGTPATPSEPG